MFSSKTFIPFFPEISKCTSIFNISLCNFMKFVFITSFVFRKNRKPKSFVISSQVEKQGGSGDITDVLRENPATITFSFKVTV